MNSKSRISRYVTVPFVLNQSYLKMEAPKPPTHESGETVVHIYAVCKSCVKTLVCFMISFVFFINLVHGNGERRRKGNKQDQKSSTLSLHSST